MRCADFKNVSIVAHYIKERTRDAQFIIISLRNNMFELADRLVRLVNLVTVPLANGIVAVKPVSDTDPAPLMWRGAMSALWLER